MSTVLKDLLRIFTASYKAVLPNQIIRKCVSYDPKYETLTISGDKFNLQSKNVYVIGAGKAVQYMAKEVDAILQSKIKQGIVSIPKKSLVKEVTNSNIQYFEGAHNNLPDVDALSTAIKIRDLAKSLTAKDFLLILISGGGSALLPLPKEPITLEEKISLIKKLANSGADIKELNAVRKKISGIKGGKLAIAAYPAQTVTLILSDIVDDPLDLIASGPTVKDEEDVENAIQIIKKYNLYKDIPHSIKEVLTESKVEDFSKDVKNFIVGSNKVSIDAAYKEAEQLKYLPIFLSRTVIGNVNEIAKEYVKIAKVFSDFVRGKIDLAKLDLEIKQLDIPGLNTDYKEILNKDPDVKEKDICLILGGEPTVEVKGGGKGGRNQHLALEFSVNIHKEKDYFNNCNIYMLAAGTDGIDGPTDAAGAIGYLNLVTDSDKENIDVNKYLKNNDSYNFYKNFKGGDYHVMTGHTQTNVMDTHLIVIQRC